MVVETVVEDEVALVADVVVVGVPPFLDLTREVVTTAADAAVDVAAVIIAEVEEETSAEIAVADEAEETFVVGGVVDEVVVISVAGEEDEVAEADLLVRTKCTSRIIHLAQMRALLCLRTRFSMTLEWRLKCQP